MMRNKLEMKINEDWIFRKVYDQKWLKAQVPGCVHTDLLYNNLIADPFYGYDAQSELEVDYNTTKAITVMAVDNLPCELPDNASRGFGKMFLDHVIPAFFNDDKDGVLERAKICENGKLTDRFSYLQDYVDGKK